MDNLSYNTGNFILAQSVRILVDDIPAVEII